MSARSTSREQRDKRVRTHERSRVSRRLHIDLYNFGDVEFAHISPEPHKISSMQERAHKNRR